MANKKGSKRKADDELRPAMTITTTWATRRMIDEIRCGTKDSRGVTIDKLVEAHNNKLTKE